jgi:hypothetical protein
MVLQMFGTVSISTGFGKTFDLNKNTVDTYEVVDESSCKRAKSASKNSLIF